MSWSVSSKGRPKDVAHHIKNQDYVPNEIKDLVSRFAKETHHDMGIEVETSGHLGSTVTVKINVFVIAPQIPDEVTPPPDPNAPTGHVDAPTVPGEPGHIPQVGAS